MIEEERWMLDKRELPHKNVTSQSLLIGGKRESCNCERAKYKMREYEAVNGKRTASARMSYIERVAIRLYFGNFEIRTVLDIRKSNCKYGAPE